MSDRADCRLQLRGDFPADKVDDLAELLVDAGASRDEYVGVFKTVNEARDFLRPWTERHGERGPTIYGEQVNGGRFHEIERYMVSWGVSFVASWESGTSFPSGIESYYADARTDAEGHGREVYAAVDDDQPVATLSEIADAHRASMIPELLDRLERARGDQLPAFCIAGPLGVLLAAHERERERAENATQTITTTV